MRVFNACLAAVAAMTLLAALVLMLTGGVATAANDNTYQVVFHLKRMVSEETIENTFNAISTPGNARYRQFLTYPQLHNLVRAPKPIADRATKYLEEEFGCTKVDALKLGDALVCTLEESKAKSFKTAKGVEDAFAIKSQEQPGIFRIDITDRLPLQIKKLIRYAHAYRHADKAFKPKTTKERMMEENKKKNVGFAGMTQTPNTINKRYSVPSSDSFPPLSKTTSVGVAEFEHSFFKEQSMNTFAVRYGLSKYNINVMGQNDPSGGGAGSTEGTLDLQYIGSVFNATLPIWWLEGSTDNNQPGQIDFSVWMDKVLAQKDVPAVVSISWGLGDYNFKYDMSILTADDDSFKKAGMVGVTLLAASGDSGVGVRRKVFDCDTFSPSYPSSSAYLTSVGATYADSMSTNEASVKWSGGGFGDSAVSSTPAWQKDAVNHYLSTNTKLPKSSYYDRNGRGYPDVSALGTNFMIYTASTGSWEQVSGTSAASPTFAGVLSLIVAERAAAGKSPLGFINPTIYKLGKVGYDVVEGQNQDTNCIPGVPIEGFAAQEGWDPVSGLGTPDYEYLRQNL